MTQDQLLQIRINQELKSKIETAAKIRGLPSSTYVKLIVSEHLKKEETLQNLDLSFSKKKLADQLINNLTQLKPKKHFTFKRALRLINDTE